MAAGKTKKNTLEDILKNFDQAMKALYGSNYKKAQKILSEIEKADIDRPELIEKAQSLLKLCQQKLDKSSGSIVSDSPEEIYNHGVFYHNNGDFEKALDLYKKSLANAGEKLDYVCYAIAATHAVQGQNDDALNSLKEAIQLNETCRIHAANDPDFTNLKEDDNFRVLVDI